MEKHADIFESTAAVLVNPVNIEGIMGAGLALRFKHRYPENYKRYKRACQTGKLKIGKLSHCEENGKIIVNLPTKMRWQDPSELSYVVQGLQDLIIGLRTRKIESVAIPALGCGLGGLNWGEVKQEIEAFFSGEAITAFVYEPH